MIRSHQTKNFIFLCLTLGALMLVSRSAAARPENTPAQRVRLTAPLAQPNETYLVWAETSPQSTESTLWAAPAARLDAASQLAQLSHRMGYPPEGSISPNGRWIAIFVIPPGVDERAARLDGGELWLAASDGSHLERLASGVGRLYQWTADSSAVAWSRLVELENPREEQIPFRTEVYRSALDGSAPALVFADESAYGVVPLGWSADGARYLAALVGMDGAWSVQAVDASSAERVESWPLPEFDQMRVMRLSPAGDRLLLDAVSGDEDVLSIVPLGSAELQATAVLARGVIRAEDSLSPVSGLWSARGQVWVATPALPGRDDAQVLAAPGTVETVTAALRGSSSLLPESWSPDEQWFAWASYPRVYSDIYVQGAQQGELRKVPSSSPENWISLFGWLGGAQ